MPLTGTQPTVKTMSSTAPIEALASRASDQSQVTSRNQVLASHITCEEETTLHRTAYIEENVIMPNDTSQRYHQKQRLPLRYAASTATSPPHHRPSLSSSSNSRRLEPSLPVQAYLPHHIKIAPPTTPCRFLFKPSRLSWHQHQQEQQQERSPTPAMRTALPQPVCR